MNVDDSASEDEHRARIEASGEAYLTAALDVSRPAETRGRVLSAAVDYLAEQAHAAPMSATQATQSFVPRITKLGSVTAACIDRDIPASALLHAADAAAEALVLPVLEKVMCLLAGFETLRSGGELDDDDDDDGDESADGGKDSDDESGVEGSTVGKRKAADPDRLPGDAKKRKTLPPARKRFISKEGCGQSYVDEYVIRLSGPAASQAHGRRRGDDNVFVATLAREAPLSKEAVLAVMENLLCRMRTCDVFELPAFIYQLLLLVSSRGSSLSKRNVLRAIVVHFAELEEKSEASALEASHTQRADVDDIIQSGVTTTVIRQIQSTTLLHIDFAVKQDPGLVSELTKLARSPADSPHSIMVPFGMAVLLALSRTPSIQISVLSTIRDAVVSFDREVAYRVQNAFATRVCKYDTEPIRNPRAALRRAVESTAKDGWDLVCEPILHLSFLLIDKGSTASSLSTTSPGSGRETESELGADMLIELFLAHSSLRSEIVDQLVTRIVLREKCSPLAVHVLSRLARRSPSDMLQCSSKIKESIADLVTLPPWTSSALISAYKPLLRARPDLLDYLFLALRKALFHREPCARAVASTGFLTVVASSDEDLPGSQGSRSLASASSADAMEDAIQPLRRALSYPPSIRALMYKEMRWSARTMGPSPQRKLVCKAFLQLLQPHLLRYVDASKAPFLLLNHCVNESAGGHLVEPLGDLIACFAEIHNASDPVAFSTGSVLHLAKSVATVCVRDFDITKTVRATGHIAGNDDAGVDVEDDEERSNIAADTANRNRARVLGGVVEALLHAVLSAKNSLHDSAFYSSVVFPLMQTREDVLNVLRELGALSASDAVRDLGGNVDIEPGAGRSIGWFGGNGKGGSNSVRGKGGKGSGKSGGGKKKAKKGGADDGEGSGSGAVVSSDLGQRFGAFGVLVTSSSSPLVSLDAAVFCLASMHSIPRAASSSAVPVDEDESDDGASKERAVSSWFSKNSSHKDTERLSLYLRAVAKAHVDSAIDDAKQSIHQTTRSTCAERSSLASSLCVLIHVAMADFQQHRAQTGLAHTKAAVRSLELVETCISAVSVVHNADSEVANRLCASLLKSSGRNRASCASRGAAFSYDGSVVSAITGLQKMFDSLVEDELLREAEVVVRMLLALRNLYRDGELVAKHQGADDLKSLQLFADSASWARGSLECRQEHANRDAGKGTLVGESGITKGLALMALGQWDSDAGLSAALNMSKRAHIVLGDVLYDGMRGEDEDARFEGPYGFIVAPNVFFAIETILDIASCAFDDVEWCLGRMSSLEAAAVTARSNLNGSSGASPRKLSPAANMDNDRMELLERRVIRAEDRANRRLTVILEILTELLRSSIAKSAIQERLFRTATRCYKILSIAVQAQARRKTDPRTTFLDMILLGKRLTPTVWDYAVLLNNDADGATRGSKAAAAMAAKEARIIPQLVYEIERFEKLLIAAQKRTKVDLLRELLRNQARDMKIDEAEDKENLSDGGENGLAGRPLSVGGLLQGRSR